MTSIIIPYFVIFSWAPKILINISAIAGTIKFIRIDLVKNRAIYNIFPYFVIVSFIITIFSIYKLKRIDDAYKNHTIQISKSIETANIGAKIFSHSMKNQLISILSDAEYLKETYENYDEIKKITQNIISTVNQSIDRLNTLHQRFNTIYINMNAVKLSMPVENALNYQCKIPSNISLIKKYDSNLPICLIDIEHMTECICVILNNAIEAIKGKEGTITITLQKLNNWGIISIEDTGCGIDKKILNKIFEPFFTTKSSRLNWGIGLSYVHKIVCAHKGKVIVESELEKGTILKIFLPVMKHG
ncbi:ATP-binding protein [Clostridium sp. SYSU_GA19001]|nr:ATP-binding protein [Clostridium caldaquaticum]